MSKRVQIEDVLNRMAALLRTYAEESWADAFCRVATSAHGDERKRTILRWYGAGGSLSDLVLHSPDTEKMKSANAEFDALRAELFRLCREGPVSEKP